MYTKNYIKKRKTTDYVDFFNLLTHSKQLSENIVKEKDKDCISKALLKTYSKNYCDS